MAIETRLDIHNDHNVYILGAGFSVDAGLPLVSNFLTKMRDAYDWLRSERREPEAKAVKAVLEFRHDAASAALRIKIDPDNIEELFSLAAAASGGDVRTEIRTAIAATLDFCEATSTQDPLYLSLPQKTPMGPGCEFLRPPGPNYTFDLYRLRPYAFYLGSMLGLWSHLWRPDAPSASASAPLPWTTTANTIITFNYDLLVERALDDLGVGCSYGFHDRVRDERPRCTSDTHVPLYKLHGSLNWADTQEQSERETDDDAPDEIADITIHGSYEDVRTAKNVSLLVPPTWNKRFTGQLARTWGNAVDALRTATRVVIVGFSMPATDVHFRYLLGAGLQHNISLRDIMFVNPEAASKPLRTRLEQVFQPHQQVSYYDTKWRDFLVHQSGARNMNRPLGSAAEARTSPPWPT